MYNGPPVAPEDIYSVYVVMNGTLGMSTGKMVAQSFHTGWRLVYAFEQKWCMGKDIVAAAAFRAWYQQGQRVRVRIAETPHVFQRVMDETVGVAQQDEGLTEVERGSITAWVTRPYLPADTPKILSHKKVQTL